MKYLKPHWKSSEYTCLVAEKINKLIDKVEDLQEEIKRIKEGTR